MKNYVAENVKNQKKFILHLNVLIVLKLDQLVGWKRIEIRECRLTNVGESGFGKKRKTVVNYVGFHLLLKVDRTIIINRSHGIQSVIESVSLSLAQLLTLTVECRAEDTASAQLWKRISLLAVIATEPNTREMKRGGPVRRRQAADNVCVPCLRSRPAVNHGHRCRDRAPSQRRSSPTVATTVGATRYRRR